MESSLPRPQGFDEISVFLTQEMKATQIPGLSLAVLHRGDLLFAQGYGVANLELAVPTSAQTVYGLGSVTKTFTAMAIMLLRQEGRLSLDDRVRTYLAEVPASWSEMTLRHLLTHAVGLPPSAALNRMERLNRRCSGWIFPETRCSTPFCACHSVLRLGPKRALAAQATSCSAPVASASAARRYQPGA